MVDIDTDRESESKDSVYGGDDQQSVYRGPSCVSRQAGGEGLSTPPLVAHDSSRHARIMQELYQPPSSPSIPIRVFSIFTLPLAPHILSVPLI